MGTRKKKMSNIFLVSDTHFGHAGVCKFTREDGSKLRPWTDPDEMDEAMIKSWNETVGPADKVYHLGDVVINRKALKILHRLNGDKVLVKGNHDIFRLEDYTPHFRDIRAYVVMTGAGIIMSHIPLHEDSHGRFGLNVHGHLHEKRVMLRHGGKPTDRIDPRYLCVCVEQTDFRPISLDEVLERSRAEGGKPGMQGPVSNWK
jgi:calcineurin-like phosphoesterase family protein